MTAFEIKAARKLAHSGADLSAYDDGVLFGCACSDFVHPVMGSLGVVAKLMRWQYVCFDGSWDERLWNEELWVYRRRIRIAELSVPAMAEWVSEQVTAKIGGAA